MKLRATASLMIARRQIIEAMYSPGPYIAPAFGLVLAHFGVGCFALSLDSSGFNAQLNPVMDLLSRTATGAFGAAFVGKLFTEGPFLVALLCATVPLLGWIAISSVSRFAVGNLVMGPGFFVLLAAVWLAACAVSAWGILCAVLAASAASALALFAWLLVRFLATLAGSFSVSYAGVRAAFTAIGAVVQWVSPFSFIARAAEGSANAWAVAAALALEVALAAALVAASSLIVSRKGVRA
jgi:hypothetical protein